MSLLRWLIRSLVFDRRIWLGVVLAAAAAVTVFTGSLLVGDSVRLSLARQNQLRLGRTGLVLTASQTLFRAQLAEDLRTQLRQPAASALLLNGWAENAEGTARAVNVSIVGVDDAFAHFAPSGKAPWLSGLGDGAVLNELLASRLSVQAGDEIILTFEKIGGLAAESVLFPESELSVSVRLPISAVADADSFGTFSLRADTAGALNVFVRLEKLAEWIEQPHRANAVLLPDGCRPSAAEQALRQVFLPEDVGLIVRSLKGQTGGEVLSRRIFIPEPIAEVLLQADEQTVGILTYFVNEIAHQDRRCPYSTVSATAPAPSAVSTVFSLLADDEIILNEWLADDLKADAGDIVTLTYYVPAPTGRTLIEQTAEFRVHSVIPMMGLGADETLMPDYPQLAQADSCRDWKPGIPIDLSRIRPKDEAYWNRYRGAPKAFISLQQAQRLWGGRFGNLTAVRVGSSMSPRQLTEHLRAFLPPAAAGLHIEPIRQQAAQSSVGKTDFSSLFFGLSMFLLISSLVLTALLFRFAVERRSEEIGLLKAMGFRRSRIRMMYLLEGLVLSAAGACLGIVPAVLYTRLLLWALSGVWSQAVAGASLVFDFHASTLLKGAAAGLAVSLFSMMLSLRHRLALPAAVLLGMPAEIAPPQSPKPRFLWTAVLLGVLGLVLSGWGFRADLQKAAAVFFVSGSLLLMSLLLFLRYSLSASGILVFKRPVSGLVWAAWRNACRRPGRSMAAAAMTAAGVFLVAAVSLNQKSPPKDVRNRRSGTGGFVLTAESALPILQNLPEAAARLAPETNWDSLGLEGVVAFRVRAGEQASCLNLNRAVQPRLLGVDPAQLRQRRAFVFREVLPGTAASLEDAWHLLEADWGPDIVPAVGDIGTVYWALGRQVGDTLVQTDEQGRPFALKIVGMLESSVLQGSLIIPEKAFLERFPSAVGYRVFLLDAQPQKAEELSAALSRTFRRWGLEVVPTVQQLAVFQAVENTYLSIFLVLGGLGLLLGTVGMGWVLWLNILERRGELAMMQAVGFRKRVLVSMLVQEHLLILSAGVLIGLLSAVPAVLPALAGRIEPVPLGLLLTALAAVIFSGWMWIRLAAASALSGPILNALRSE